MTSTPVTRLSSWWRARADQSQRPHDKVRCAYCSTVLLAGEGKWDAEWKELVCGSIACTDAALASHSW